jgi:hypothetical protein
MALPAEDKNRQDYYAKLARVDFEKTYTRWDSAADVARWWDKWCVYDKTNHDRLGWMLMHHTGVREWKGDRHERPYLFKDLDKITTL